MEPVESVNERDEGRDIGLVQLVLYGGEFDAGKYVGCACFPKKEERKRLKVKVYNLISLQL